MSEDMMVSGMDMDTVVKMDPIVREPLPVLPVGWHILVEMRVPQDRTDSGIIELPPETQQVQEANEYVGRVVALGHLSYMDETKFSPRNLGQKNWCNVGDWVAFNKYAGQTVRTRSGKLYRVLEDENIYGVVPDPEQIHVPY